MVRRCMLTCAALLWVSSLLCADALLVEVEKLEFGGDWRPMRGSKVVRDFMWSGSRPGPAPMVGAIDLPHGAKWRLWARSKDYPTDRPGIRHLTVRLGAKRSATVFGRHAKPGKDGWAWEDGGTFDLPAGPLLIVVGDEATPYARCDALVLSDDKDYVPKGLPYRLGLPAAKAAPLELKAADGERGFVPPPLRRVEGAALATIGNERFRLSFHAAETDAGMAIAARGAIRVHEEWKALPTDAGAEGYRVLFRPKGSDPAINAGRVYPTWDISLAPSVEARAGGASAKTSMGTPTAPWAAGECFAVRPTSARAVDERTAVLGFEDLCVGALSATWQVSEKEPYAKVTLQFTPKKDGHFSLGYHGLLAAAPDDLDFILLPFMFHGRRFPARPMVLLNALTPTPVSLVNRAGMSYAVVAEPADLPFEWAGPDNSRYALGIRNESAQAQPLIYSPVLGQPGSVTEEAKPIIARFRVWMAPGTWYDAYRGVAESIFGLTDYRRPTYASLSDTALNLMDLLRSEKASGWDAFDKGPVQIEAKNNVTHASPLTYLSYYLLTGDERFYCQRALPALEFLLSRPMVHFGCRRDLGDRYYTGKRKLRGPVSLYGATVFAGAYRMTSGRTTAFGELCLTDDGEPRRTAGYSHIQPFEDALALYRLAGEKRWLDAAIQNGDEYIEKHIRQLPTRDLGRRPFINISFVPDWEGLLHLYEATGERRFLDASTEGGRWLLTSLWTQPPIPDGDVTIHPGGTFDVSKHVWWYGDRHHRLGVFDGDDAAYEKRRALETVPPAKIPERRVPAWQVSRIGLGLEQPCTYTSSRRHRNIMMSVWAPNLLRLYRHSGDGLFRTAARNSTIGRYGNYPGYYLIGHTDHQQRPDYPLVGPDVTFIYYHHIPPFAAYILDYLFTDVEVRSEGKIAFPWVRQFGYAWFDSRLRGHAPGTVYGEAAWPWLHRTAAAVDNVKVDRVLAHGDGKFHTILLNQVWTREGVRVTFDEKVLGRSLEGATVRVRQDGKVADSLTVKDCAVSVRLPRHGLAVLSIDGVKIDVPTHRGTPPAKLPLPIEPGLRVVPIEGTDLDAIGTEIIVPPFTWRDLYVYVAAGIDDCKSATLCYRLGNDPVLEVTDEEYPWEFSIRVDDMTLPLTWTVKVSR